MRTKSTSSLSYCARETLEGLSTVLTLYCFWTNPVDVCEVLTQKIVGLSNAFAAVDSVFVARIVLEIGSTPLTLGRLYSTTPVAVVIASVWITVFAVLPSRLRVVEI